MEPFQERQRFNQPWIIILLGIVLLLSGAAAVSALLNGSGVVVALLTFLFMLALALVFFSLRLEYTIDADGISYRFLPFLTRWRKLSKPDIVSAEVIRYYPLKDYGGWGIRYGRRGWAYTVKGTSGIAVTLTGGKYLLIGTSSPEAAAAALLAFGYRASRN